jgi:hypothetical protein
MTRYKVSLPKLKEQQWVTDTDPRVSWSREKFGKTFHSSGWNPVTYNFKNKNDFLVFLLRWA